MIDIMFIGQNVGISGYKSEEKHQHKHFWIQEDVDRHKGRKRERSFGSSWR